MRGVVSWHTQLLLVCCIVLDLAVSIWCVASLLVLRAHLDDRTMAVSNGKL